MMLPAGWVTDVLPSRTKALKCLGNGVVPAQAMYALRGLLDRYGLDAVGFGESVADEYRRPRVGIDTFGDVGVVEGNGQGDLCHVDDSDARVPEVKRVG